MPVLLLDLLIAEGKLQLRKGEKVLVAAKKKSQLQIQCSKFNALFLKRTYFILPSFVQVFVCNEQRSVNNEK